VFRARGTLYNVDTEAFIATHTGGSLAFKTNAVDLTFSGGPSTTGPPTADAATVQQAYFPNTRESVATASFQYRILGSPTWLETAGANANGYSSVNRIVTISGLDGNTTYQYRLRVTRTTNNGIEYFGSIGTFLTLPDQPTITTNAASSIGATSAVLNGTVDPNTLGVRVRFGWGTADGGSSIGAWQNLSSTENISGDGDIPFSVSLTGLSFSTPYFFRAFVEWPTPGLGEIKSGVTLSFSTTADPAQAAKDAEMLPIQDFDRKYGVATTIYFVVPVPSATSSDAFYTGAAVWDGAGESKINKETAGVLSGFADTTNDPVQESSQLYSLALTAAEMQCDQAFIVLTDGGGAVRDVLLRIRTHQMLGSVDIDAATGQRANTTAFKATGYQAGHGISAVAGATGKDIDGVIAEHFLRTGTAFAGGSSTIDLGSGAFGSNDLYNGNIIAIIGGTGVGQSRVIIDYTASNQRCDVDSSWTTNPDNTSVWLMIEGQRPWNIYRSELSALPADNANYGDKLQLILQRFAFKITQSATVQTLFKADGSTSLATRSVSDAAGLQTVGKLA
jgi:hypothetical protein